MLKTISISAISLLLTMQNIAQAETPKQEELPTECIVAIKLMTSPESLKDNADKLPQDMKGMSSQQISELLIADFSQMLQEDPDNVFQCTSKIKRNIQYRSALNFPQQCEQFLTTFQKQQEEIALNSENAQPHVDDATVKLLMMNEQNPKEAAEECSAQNVAYRVDIEDPELKTKYPLPTACEQVYTKLEQEYMASSMSQHMARQRVYLATQHKSSPDQVEQKCSEIAKEILSEK